jgi:hypothetical protein
VGWGGGGGPQALFNRRKTPTPAPVAARKPGVVGSAPMDIERELAAIHRSFMRAYGGR